MTKDDRITDPLARRRLLTGGAVLAGAAGASVLSAALAPATAQAADGESIKVGQASSGTDTTSLTITGTSDPALSLTNESGPALHLNVLPTDFQGELDPGDVVGTTEGLLVGVDYLGPESVKVATSKDLDLLPLLTPVAPIRALDTRSAQSREDAIVRKSSSSAIDSHGRLTKNSWIDVGVVTSQDVSLVISGAFLNTTAVGPSANGYLTVYPPGDRPAVSNLNFSKGVTLSNTALVALATDLSDFYVVRVHSTQTTHLILDLFGLIVGLSPYGGEGAGARHAAGLRAARQNKRAARPRRSLRAG